MSFLFIFAYLAIRVAGDFYWRTVTPWAAYSFEIAFVFAATYFYRKRLRFKISLRPLVLGVVLSLLSGFAIYKLITSAGLEVPFDFQSREFLFLLLVFGPILEELIFRMALWEPSVDWLKKQEYALILTTILFSLGHLQAFWSIPLMYRPFVLIQALYVILLGLGCGYAKIKTNSLSGAVAVHLGFNAGFYLASLC